MAGKRIAYAGIGLFATSLGIVGVFLPGLPTVPFILVAMWAFSSSSQRLHDWLKNIPLLKDVHKEIDAFQTSRSLDRRVKFISQFSAWLSVAIELIVGFHIAVTLTIAAIAIACSFFMWRVPTRAVVTNE